MRGLAALGFASGLPYLLTSGTLSTWLAREKVDVGTIGLFALVGLPYSFKFAWAPLLDRYRLPWLGRRRGWLAVLSLSLGMGIAGLAMTRPARAPLLCAAVALAVALLSASLDVVTDAYTADVLLPEERGAGPAASVFGYRVAMLISGGLALVLADWMSWPWVYCVMAFLMLVGPAAAWAAPEPARGRAPSSLGEAVVAPFAAFFGRRHAVASLVFITFYRMGDTALAHLVNPFLLSVGFSQTEVGLVNKVVGIGATIVGALGGGGLVARIGLYRALWVFGVAQAATNIAYNVIAISGHRLPLLFVAVAVDNVCTGLAIAASVAFIVSRCDPRYSATQFALLTSAAGVLGRAATAGAGYVVERAGWPAFFALTMIAVIPALLLLPLLRRSMEEPATGSR